MNNYLYHHGIKGMSWGKKNGPPYPLGSSQRTAREKKLTGSSQSKSAAKLHPNIDKLGRNKDNKEKQKSVDWKKAAKIGAIATASVLAVGGAVYLSKTGRLQSMGKKVLAGNGFDASSKNIKHIIDSPALPCTEKMLDSFLEHGIKLQSVKESFQDSIKNTNKNLRLRRRDKNNCVYSAVAGYMRSQGADVIAQETPRQKQQFLQEVVKKAFNNSIIPDGGSAKLFKESPDSAKAMLVRLFGENTAGAVSVNWKDNKGGHAFNFFIKNGEVTFADFKEGLNEAEIIANRYWEKMNDKGLELAVFGDEITSSIKSFVKNAT